MQHLHRRWGRCLVPSDPDFKKNTGGGSVRETPRRGENPYKFLKLGVSVKFLKLGGGVAAH